jgi:hypothetical protein
VLTVEVTEQRYHPFPTLEIDAVAPVNVPEFIADTDIVPFDKLNSAAAPLAPVALSWNLKTKTDLSFALA